MMAQFGINIGKPQNFADWTQYAGFNPNQSVIGLSSGDRSPIAPPTMGQMGKTISNVGNQLAQGNIADAYKTYTTGLAPIAPTAPKPFVAPVQQAMPDDGMTHEFED